MVHSVSFITLSVAQTVVCIKVTDDTLRVLDLNVNIRQYTILLDRLRYGDIVGLWFVAHFGINHLSYNLWSFRDVLHGIV